MKFVETSTPAVVTSTVEQASLAEFELENRRFRGCAGSRSVGWCASGGRPLCRQTQLTRTLNWADLESDSASPGQAGGPRPVTRTDIMIELVLERSSSLNLNIRVAESGQRAAVHGGRLVSLDS